MYDRNTKVVYPGHGVAVIEAVIEKKIGDRSVTFFQLNFLYKDMTILVPVNSTEGIRPLGTSEEIDSALSELGKVPQQLESSDFTPSSWNKRNKSYQLKIQGGKFIDIARIYRDLMHTAKYKELSFGEKNLLQVAEDLLLQEILIVKNKDRDVIVQELRNPFKQFTFVNQLAPSETSTTI